MRKRNLLATLPLLLAGCAPSPAGPSTILTPAPEVVSVEATPTGQAPIDPEATPLAEGAVNPLDPTSNSSAAATPVATVSSPLVETVTPAATFTPEASSIILPTPTNVSPTPTPIPRTAKQEVANFGGQLEKALLKQDCERVGAEAANRLAYYEETQQTYIKEKDDEGVAYCQAALNSLDKIVLAAKTKTEILKGERYHTQMANVEQMIQDAIIAAP